MSASFPRVASGVEAVPSQDPDVLSIRVPSGETISLHAMDWQVAKLMDGTRSLEQLANAAGNFGLTSSIDEMLHLVRQFEAYGILEQPPPSSMPWRDPADSDDLEGSEPARAPAYPPEPGHYLNGKQPYDDASDPRAAVLNAPPSNIFVADLHESAVSAEQEFPSEEVEDDAPALGDDPELIEESPSAESSIPPYEREADAAEPPLADVADVDDVEERSAEERSEEPESEQVSIVRPRRRRSWFGWVLLLLVAGAVAALAVIPVPVRHPAIAYAERRHALVAGTQGTLSELKKRHGDTVVAGEVIATFGAGAGPDEDATPEKLRAELEAKKAELEAKKGAALSGDELKRRVAAKRREAFLAATKLKRIQAELGEDETSDELEEAEEELQTRRKELAQAMAALKTGRPGAAAELPPEAQEEIQALEAKLAAAEKASSAAVKSPADGVLYAPDLEQRIGTVVHPSQLLGEVMEVSQVRVDILVPQSALGDYSLRKAVTFRPSSNPDMRFEGVVDRIAPSARWAPSLDQAVFHISAQVKNEGGALRDGMPGFIELKDHEHSVLNALLPRARRWAERELLP